MNYAERILGPGYGTFQTNVLSGRCSGKNRTSPTRPATARSGDTSPLAAIPMPGRNARLVGAVGLLMSCSP